MKNKKLLFVLSIGMLFTSCAKKTQNTSLETSLESSGLVSSVSNESIGASSEKKELKNTTLYLVGDSTVCSFNDTSYYYPRYGYGTQLSTYFNDKVTVVNYALSGRSTNSFIKEDNYTALKNNLKAGDYLMIGFGHNDEKSDDDRFADARKTTEEEGSFKYNLYNYYIKLAKDVGATPILCTPVSRVNKSEDYTGESAHKTATGDYAKAIKELGEEKDTTVIDLTSMTADLYSRIGYAEAIKYHAWTISKEGSVDKTHLNIYGAKNVAYMFASTLKQTTNPLGEYVLDDIKAPTESDRVTNPSYVEKKYEAPDFSVPLATPYMFSCIESDWHGTAFGDTGGNPSSDSSGYFAREKVEGTFEVGQFLESGSKKGKITTTEGIAFVFRQVSITKNFKISCDVEVTKCGNVTEAGFGLMLRDDVYMNQKLADNTIKSNYVAAGFYTTSGTTNVGYSRESGTLKNNQTASGLYTVGATAKLYIERVGQVINTKVIYNEKEYLNTYTDFDLRAIDNDYVYVGMYGCRGTMSTFTNVAFEITGEAQEA